MRERKELFVSFDNFLKIFQKNWTTKEERMKSFPIVETRILALDFFYSPLLKEYQFFSL